MSGICGVSGQQPGAVRGGKSPVRARETHSANPANPRKAQVRGQKSLRGLRFRTTR